MMIEERWNEPEEIQDRFEMSLSDKILGAIVALLAVLSVMSLFYLADEQRKIQCSFGSTMESNVDAVDAESDTLKQTDRTNVQEK